MSPSWDASSAVGMGGELAAMTLLVSMGHALIKVRYHVTIPALTVVASPSSAGRHEGGGQEWRRRWHRRWQQE
ncbi:hypothetical protein E2562_035603 [Oryza meyeriana var. granulata]|uniref:Uncharacterized protein n=1 Tax=Oryza meyeriana var. granulata TaxID=110450 RepID=A0A6G1ESW0_9ORYZ|nr:hypothetical protein E2562_035603 [Oryza meyeriana var. granulata]